MQAAPIGNFSSSPLAGRQKLQTHDSVEEASRGFSPSKREPISAAMHSPSDTIKRHKLMNPRREREKERAAWGQKSILIEIFSGPPSTGMKTHRARASPPDNWRKEKSRISVLAKAKARESEHNSAMET